GLRGAAGHRLARVRLRRRRAALRDQPAVVQRDRPRRAVSRGALHEPAAVPGRRFRAADPVRVDDEDPGGGGSADRRRDRPFQPPRAGRNRPGHTREMNLRERLARKPPGYQFTIGRVLAIYSGLMVALLLAALDQTIVATALPRVVSDLGGITQYAWVFTAYMLGSTVTVPLYGQLGHAHRR